MCRRHTLEVHFTVELDGSNRPILCGRMVGWAPPDPDALPGLGIRSQTLNLDGIHLTDLNKLVWNWMHHGRYLTD